MIAFRGTPGGVPYVDNHGVILSGQAKGGGGVCSDEVSGLIHETSKVKAISVKSSCIVKIKFMNKIQYIKIHKNHNIVFYIIIFFIMNKTIYFIQFKQAE